MLLITDLNKLDLHCNNAALSRFKRAENDITSFMKTRMLETPRNYDVTYRVSINGRIVEHHPSFPNEFPAVMTGNLINSVNAKAIKETGNAMLQFGVLPGTSDLDGIGYAYMLEIGTEIAAPRPWLTYTKLHAKKVL